MDTTCLNEDLQDKEGKYPVLLNIVDSGSKWAWSYPLLDKSANSVLEALKLLFRKTKLIPKTIKTDNGGEFSALVIKTYL